MEQPLPYHRYHDNERLFFTTMRYVHLGCSEQRAGHEPLYSVKYTTVSSSDGGSKDHDKRSTEIVPPHAMSVEQTSSSPTGPSVSSAMPSQLSNQIPKHGLSEPQESETLPLPKRQTSFSDRQLVPNVEAGRVHEAPIRQHSALAAGDPLPPHSLTPSPPHTLTSSPPHTHTPSPPPIHQNSALATGELSYPHSLTSSLPHTLTPSSPSIHQHSVLENTLSQAQLHTELHEGGSWKLQYGWTNSPPNHTHMRTVKVKLEPEVIEESDDATGIVATSRGDSRPGISRDDPPRSSLFGDQRLDSQSRRIHHHDHQSRSPLNRSRSRSNHRLRSPNRSPRQRSKSLHHHRTRHSKSHRQDSRSHSRHQTSPRDRSESRLRHSASPVDGRSPSRSQHSLSPERKPSLQELHKAHTLYRQKTSSSPLRSHSSGLTLDNHISGQASSSTAASLDHHVRLDNRNDDYLPYQDLGSDEEETVEMEEDEYLVIDKPNAKGVLFHCSVCDLSLSSATTLQDHFAGVRHQKKLKSLGLNSSLSDLHSRESQSKFGEIVRCKLCDIIISATECAVHLAGPQHRSSAEKIDTLPLPKDCFVRVAKVEGSSASNGGTYQCNLCGVTIMTYSAFQIHIGGKKHSKKLKIMEDKVEAEASGSVASIPSFGQFQCQICNIFCTCQEALDAHFVGKKHYKMLKSKGLVSNKHEEDAAKTRQEQQRQWWDKQRQSGPLKWESKTMRCTICWVKLSSAQEVHRHLASQEHLDKVLTDSECPVQDIIVPESSIHPGRYWW